MQFSSCMCPLVGREVVLNFCNEFVKSSIWSNGKTLPSGKTRFHKVRTKITDILSVDEFTRLKRTSFAKFSRISFASNCNEWIRLLLFTLRNKQWLYPSRRWRLLCETMSHHYDEVSLTYTEWPEMYFGLLVHAFADYMKLTSHWRKFY